MTVEDPIVELTLADAPALYSLGYAADMAESGVSDYTLEDMSSGLREKAYTAWGIRDSAGELRAAAWLEAQSHRPNLGGELLTLPSAPPRDSERLVDLMLETARGDDQHRSVHAFAAVGNRAKQDLFASRGGTVVRHFLLMDIDLSAWSPTVPAWPNGVTVRLVDCNDDADLRRMHHVIGTAFEDHWNHATSPFEEWKPRHLGRDDFDPTLWWLVFRGEAAIAGMICSFTGDGGYVGALGTLRAGRGQGLGTALLNTAFDEFNRRGASRASLHVDSDSPTRAVHLYESVGMHIAADYACYDIKP